MAKSSRASVVKRNNQNLKKKVFGPAETARNERLSARLLKLAQQPKSLRSEMEVERDAKDASVEAKEDRATEDVDMDADESDADAKPMSRSNKSLKREKIAKAARIEKKRYRKTTNRVAFAKHPKKGKMGKKR